MDMAYTKMQRDNWRKPETFPDIVQSQIDQNTCTHKIWISSKLLKQIQKTIQSTGARGNMLRI